jgi:hypothetical protein
MAVLTASNRYQMLAVFGNGLVTEQFPCSFFSKISSLVSFGLHRLRPRRRQNTANKIHPFFIAVDFGLNNALKLWNSESAKKRPQSLEKILPKKVLDKVKLRLK